MNRHFLQLLMFAIVLVVFQVLIIGKLPLSTYVCPEVYLMFILVLPFQYSTIKSMLWAFALGMTIDVCSYGILGLHTIPLVAVAFIRPYLLKMVTAANYIESIQIPSSRTLDFRPFLTYVTISTLAYISVLFCLDNYSFHNFLHLFLRILFSTIVTTLFIIVLQYAFTGTRNNKR